MNHAATTEAKAVRTQRQRLRREQRDDPLAKRARLIAFWRQCAETNRGYLPYKGAWWHSFLIQPGFRALLMPRLRAMLDARDKEHRERYAAELRESCKRWEQQKAERAAAKARAKLPQLDLLDAMAQTNH